jgi:alkanesulfonate monooxygenase SsuD/methylene tetrahydromethanopterin reductase-like flavin-dependent oxidoreductase (luciferase family)
MRYGVSIPPFTDPRAVVEMATDAEAAGWDGVFLWDHLQWSPEVKPDVHDPWVLLGAIAMATERVMLGTLVTPLARRRPVVVAKHVSTLDHFSRGRAILGVGLGEPPVEDFSSFGDEPDPRVRGAMLDEALDVVDGLLRGDPVSYDGAHFIAHAQLRPGPLTLPRPPIWVAGVVPNRRPLRRALRFDGVVPIGPGELLEPQALADYLALARDRPAGWDVVAEWAPGIRAAEHADAGATWLIESTFPAGDWEEEFRGRVRSGPSTPAR